MSKVKNYLFTPSPQLLDAVMDGYVTWREESVAVNAAYHSWTKAPLEQRRLAFDHYLAALDREEGAASHYGRLIEEVGRV